MKTNRILAILTTAFLLASTIAKAGPWPNYAAPAEAPPKNTMLFNEKHAAVAVQTGKEVKFVLVHAGPLSSEVQSWEGRANLATTWGFEGKLHLLDGKRTRAAGHNVDNRKIAVKYTSSEPDTLYLDGKSYALNTSGRVFILREKGKPVQIMRTLPLRNMDDLVKLGTLTDSELLKADAPRQIQMNPERKPAIHHVPAEAKAEGSDPIDQLVAKLSATRGLWVNGAYPIIRLPESATPEQILEQVFKFTGFDKGHVKDFKILQSRNVQITGGSYSAALVQTDLGRMIVLFTAGGAWSRVYELPL